MLTIVNPPEINYCILWFHKKIFPDNSQLLATTPPEIRISELQNFIKIEDINVSMFQ